MDKIVTLDTYYVGRMLKPSNGDFKIKFYVSKTGNKPWDLKVEAPVVYETGSMTFSSASTVPGADPEARPLTLTNGTGSNNQVYEHLASTGSVDIRVDSSYTHYMVTTVDCKKCSRMYEDDSSRFYEGEFIVASGSIEEFE